MSSEPRKVALITGGARRVGAAVALKLAESGYDIAFTYFRSAAEANNLVSELTARGATGVAIEADLSQPEDAVDQVDLQFATKFERLDLLVNNASLYKAGNLEQVDAADIRAAMAIHIEAPLLLAKQFASLLRRSRGSIINMIDIQAERPVPTHLAYCASKAGLWNLTLGLARDLAPEVRVNGIAPGVVEWPASLSQTQKQAYLSRVPLARAGDVCDVANAVIYLTQASYITGQILRIDGGRSIV